MNLPKQWNDWTQRAGLRNSYSTDMQRKYEAFYFKGHGRNWRIDCEGNLDMSEPFDAFDRWANSCEKSEPMTAKTCEEFKALVQGMLKP